MNTVLQLTNKIVTPTGNMYSFIRNGQPITVPEYEAQQLIQAYPSKARNCRVINGAISLKTGELPVECTKNKLGRLRIYTNLKYNKDRTFIFSNDIVFNRIAGDKAFLEKCSDIIKAIDGAAIIDYKLQTVITPYGTCSVNNLSTGLKTVLNIYYCLQYPKKKFLVNINECGENALHYVFPAVADSNVYLFLEHEIFYMPDNYVYIANNKSLTDPVDLCDLFWED